MSWHYLPAPAEESWPACCSDGEPWRPSRLKNTPVRFCCNGNLTDAYLTSLSGTISEHSTVIRGADMSTSSREGSPARTSATPALALESGANDPVYAGRKMRPISNTDENGCSRRDRLLAHGVAHRVGRLAAIGNGQVPAVAATAFVTLYKRMWE